MTLSEFTRHIIWLNNVLMELDVNYKSIMYADSHGEIDLLNIKEYLKNLKI